MLCRKSWGHSAVALAALLCFTGCKATQSDPRTALPQVALAIAAPAYPAEMGFTGIVAARVQSDLGFRVGGMVVARLVDLGQRVKAGQPLMRLDPTDFDHAVTAQIAAVASAQANLTQAEADAARDAKLVGSGSVSTQDYIDKKAAAAAARAQLDAAKAQLKIAQDNLRYSTLYADADGVVVNYLANPGQVVAAGQTVVILAQSGPREAAIDLPEGLRPAIGSIAKASLYGDGKVQANAVLRELSDAADPVTRTFAARYVLQGAMAHAPLGTTVMIYLTDHASPRAVQIPIAAVYDPGSGPGVWLYDKTNGSVHFQHVSESEIGEETIAINHGLTVGQEIVSMGANQLHEGEKVRVAAAQGGAP